MIIGRKTSKQKAKRLHEKTRAGNKEKTDIRDFENKEQKEFGNKGLWDYMLVKWRKLFQCLGIWKSCVESLAIELSWGQSIFNRTTSIKENSKSEKEKKIREGTWGLCRADQRVSKEYVWRESKYGREKGKFKSERFVRGKCPRSQRSSILFLGMGAQ